MGGSQPKLFQNCDFNAQRTLGALEDILTRGFPLRDGPLWSCKACDEGVVMLSTTRVLIQETPTSMGGRLSEGGWDPEMTIEKFVGIASCDHCGDPTSMAGDTHTRPSAEDNRGGCWTTYLALRYVHPPPVLVRRPSGLPTSIEDALTLAEGLIWTNLGSAERVLGNLIEDVLADGSIRGVLESKKNWTIEARGGLGLTLGDLLNRFELLDGLIDDVYAPSVDLNGLRSPVATREPYGAVPCGSRRSTAGAPSPSPTEVVSPVATSGRTP